MFHEPLQDTLVQNLIKQLQLFFLLFYEIKFLPTNAQYQVIDLRTILDPT